MVISCFFSAENANAELVERIVAVVNDDVILLSEFKEALRRAEDSVKKVNEKEIIDGMVNDLLLLEQARKFSFGKDVDDAVLSNPEKVINSYTDKRIKALIHIPFRDIEAYYYNNSEKYGERDIYDVKSEIEEYLLKRTLEIKIQEHIDELKEEAMIRIQLETD